MGGGATSVQALATVIGALRHWDAPEKAQGRPAAAERPCWPGVAGQRLLPGGGEAYATPSLRPRKRSCPLRPTSISTAFLSLDLACCAIRSRSCGEAPAAPSTSRSEEHTPELQSLIC